MITTVPPGLTAPQTDDPAAAGFISVSRQRGTVLFANPNNKIVIDAEVNDGEPNDRHHPDGGKREDLDCL